MSKLIQHRSHSRMIFISTIMMTVGLILIQSNRQVAGAFVGKNVIRNANSATPTRTATPFSFDVGNGGCQARKWLIPTLQARATGNPSTNYVCGKLLLVKDHKTGKDFLLLEPCEKGAFYIFKVRPDELHEYYQLMNVQFVSGEKIYTEGYGVLSKYIKTFSGYYVLENCLGCGVKPVYISTAEIIFPTSTWVPSQATIYPTIPPFPTQAEVASLITPSPTPGLLTTSTIPSSVSPTVKDTPPPDKTQQTTATTAAVYLTLMDLKSEPEEPIQNHEVTLHVTIQNLGFPIGKPIWDYSGKVVLKAADGKVLEESEFTSDHNSSIQVVKSMRVQAETWEITIALRFRQLVNSGEVEVFVQPSNYLTYIYPRSVKTRITIRSEATPTTTKEPYASQAVIQPSAIQTERVPSRPSFCIGLSTALSIPAVAVLLLRKRTRRIP